jgi:hypothetical protein
MELPVILAGPMLRRTEYDAVHVWIALSEPYKIQPLIYEVCQNDAGFNYEPFEISYQQKTVHLGNKLYINLIKIMPKGEAFPIDSLICYDLKLSKDNSTMDLNSLGLLNPQKEGTIVYGNLKYPSFFITETTRSRILYGSCRKIPGKGHDALQLGDTFLSENYLNVNDRPEALFLMGDQIFADTVPDIIAPILQHLGKTLVGRTENLSAADYRLNKDPYKTLLDNPNGRQQIAIDLCGFTSQNAASHLFRFGEYAAMYLMSWNPDFWNIKEVEESLKISKNFQDYCKFKERLFQIRRLLANIPTYMIFNEHDITSDWNTTIEWKDKVWGSSLGRHVICNGLTAYWAFQAWGNMPGNFDDNFIQTISKGLNSSNISSKPYKDWLSLLGKYENWHFVAPTYPLAVFLDIRTKRTIPTKKNTKIEEGGELIHRLGWLQTIEKLYDSGWQPGDPLIAVSPVPLYGIGLFKSLFGNSRSPIKLAGIHNRSFDVNLWKYNGKSFEGFHQWINDIDPEYCILLSGNAHYAFSLKTEVLYLNGDKKTIHQFTSSPLNIKTYYGTKGQIMKTMLTMPNRNNTSINRTQNDRFQIILEHDFGHPTVSKEIMNFHPMDSGSLIEIENNLGVLTVINERVDNIFLKQNTISDYTRLNKPIQVLE